MSIEKAMAKITKGENWEEYQLKKYTLNPKKKRTTYDFATRKSELGAKIDNFTKVDGIFLISNSERKRLIEQEIEQNMSK